MKKMKTIIPLIVLIGISVVVFGAVPKKEPFNALGTDFLALRGTVENGNPYVDFLFDNTNLYVDADNDGVWDYEQNRDGAQEFCLENLPIAGGLKTGAKIRADKPIALFGRRVEYTHSAICGWREFHANIPPLNSIKKEYFVPFGTYYVQVEEDTTINIDVNNTGGITNSFLAHKMAKDTTTIPEGSFARIFADKPFYLFSKKDNVGSPSNDFFIHSSNIVRLVVTEDNTTIQVDKNNDRHYDATLNYDKGVYGTLYDYNSGSIIHSDKPIIVISDECEYLYSLPMDEAGSDYYLSRDDRVVGLFANTLCKIERQEYNKAISEVNLTVDATTVYTIWDNRVHIWCDKPILVYGENILYPASTIIPTMYSTQKYLGANELTTMELRIFNPFAETDVYNLTASVLIPDSFSLPNDPDVPIAIEKRYLRNDTVIAADNPTVSATAEGDNIKFEITKDNTGLFETLEAMTYINMQYELTTPSSLGSYEFEPVTIGYDADTWNIPR